MVLLTIERIIRIEKRMTQMRLEESPSPVLVSSNLSSVRLKSLGDNILGLCVGEGIMVPGHRSSSSRGHEEDVDTLAAAEDSTGVDCMKAGDRLESQQQLGAGCRAAGCTAALSADTVQLHPVSLYSCTRQGTVQLH